MNQMQMQRMGSEAILDIWRKFRCKHYKLLPWNPFFVSDAKAHVDIKWEQGLLYLDIEIHFRRLARAEETERVAAEWSAVR